MCPLHLVVPTAFAYYLVGLPETASLEKVVRFSEWLQAEAAAMAAEIGARGLRTPPAANSALPGDAPVPLIPELAAAQETSRFEDAP
jgi:hypothetical protein